MLHYAGELRPVRVVRTHRLDNARPQPAYSQGLGRAGRNTVLIEGRRREMRVQVGQPDPLKRGTAGARACSVVHWQIFGAQGVALRIEELGVPGRWVAGGGEFAGVGVRGCTIGPSDRDSRSP